MDFTLLLAAQLAAAVVAIYVSKYVKRYISSYQVFQRIKRYPGMPRPLLGLLLFISACTQDTHCETYLPMKLTDRQTFAREA